MFIAQNEQQRRRSLGNAAASANPASFSIRNSKAPYKRGHREQHSSGRAARFRRCFVAASMSIQRTDGNASTPITSSLRHIFGTDAGREWCNLLRQFNSIDSRNMLRVGEANRFCADHARDASDLRGTLRRWPARARSMKIVCRGKHPRPLLQIWQRGSEAACS